MSTSSPSFHSGDRSIIFAIYSLLEAGRCTELQVKSFARSQSARFEHVGGEEAAQLGELGSDDEHLVAWGSVSFQKFSISSFGQVVPFLLVHKFSAFLAGGPCAGAASRK